MPLNGNPDLCGPEVFQLSACPTPRGHHTIVKIQLLLVSGAIAFLLSFFLLIFLWRRNMHIQKIDVSRAIFQKLEHRRISYQELQIATNGFVETNLLGTSSFGSVYKGILSDGALVVVKVLQLKNDQREKNFKEECNVLQKVRHRNIVRIITSCSNLHFKGLVFEFMANKILEKHLYPNRDGKNGEDVCELGLKS
jgi:LRR receptor-like serine/threonine-protein kinase FLS2